MYKTKYTHTNIKHKVSIFNIALVKTLNIDDKGMLVSSIIPSNLSTQDWRENNGQKQ